MKKVEVKTLDDLDIVLRVARAMFDLKGKVEVLIKELKLDRSLEQNALYWKWLSVIAAETGHSKEEMAEIYKGKFLIAIFARDDPEYAEMAHAIKQVKQQSPKDYQAIRTQVIKMTSTTKCNVTQMREYLNLIDRHAGTELNIRLPLPEHQGLV